VESQSETRRAAWPFVGRARELRIAASSLAALQAGRGGAIVLAGEPGIGKTALAGQLGARAARLGLRVACGRCVADEGAPPLWPWRQILSACRSPQAPGEPAGQAPDLAFAALGAADRLEHAGAPADGSDRFRLLWSVAAEVMAAAAPCGLVVVIDDLHCADPLSALVLARLAPDLAASRLLLVAAHQDLAVTSDAPAAAAIAALASAPGTVRLRLAGLAEVEVADQLGAICGRRLEKKIVDGITRRTLGNPFFVAELGRLLDESALAGPAAKGWESGLPDGVRAAVGQRLDRLPASCRDVLRTAAVIGPALEVGTVAAVSELTAGVVLAELDAAFCAGLLQASSAPPAVEFSHALLRDTLREEVPVSRRLDIHRRAAEHIEAAHRDDLAHYAAELAGHWLSALPAGDASRAVLWAERAATAAMTSLAYEEAAQWYERALHAIRGGGFSDKDRFRLLLGRAQALCKSGDVSLAISFASQAGEEARRRRDPMAMAAAALALEGVADDGWGRQVIQLADGALRELAGEHEELRARLLAAQAMAHSSSLTDHDGASQAEPLSRKALALAETAATPSALVSALQARQMACAGPDGVNDRLKAAERMVAIAVTDGDPWAELWGRLWRIDAHCQLGATDAAETELDKLASITERLRQPVASWHLARARCSLAIGRGRFAEAGRHLDEAANLAQRGLDQRAKRIQAIIGAKLAILTGDPRLEHWLATLDQAAGQPGWPGRRLPRILHLISRGELDLARDEYARLAPWQGWQVPHFVAHTLLDLRGRAAAQLGDLDGAAVAYERLRPWARYFVVGGTGLVAMYGSAEHALGCLAACLGKSEAAERHLRSAAAANERAGLPPFELESRHELAKVLADRARWDDRSEALAHARYVARAAAGLGMRPLSTASERLASVLRDGESGGPPGLTHREREIAALVADGLTNRQIADVLHLAERTAENHVQHILAKLGFRNRTQIAVWAAARRRPR
jgi:DNA-binding CsgD family transcriptional regulator